MSKGFYFFSWLLIIGVIVTSFFINAAIPKEYLKTNTAQLPEDFTMKQTSNEYPSNESPNPQLAGLQKLGIKKLCFSRNGIIYLQDIVANRLRQIIKGEEPSLAPTGDKIAFTYNSDKQGERHIKIFRLDNGQLDELNNIAGFISYNPHWSNDGNKIAFNIKIKDRWEVGLLDIINDGWNIITDKLMSDSGFFFNSWSADNKSIICNDLEFIYEIALDGKLLRRTDIKTVVDSQSISSTTKFSLSPDQKYLLFNSSPSPEENGIIFVFDLMQQKLLQITPKAIDSFDPQWLPSGNEIIFSSRELNENNLAIYNIRKISVDGSSLATVIENASHASYTRQ